MVYRIIKTSCGGGSVDLGSSAYGWCLKSSTLHRRELRGVVFIMNNSGPSTELWRTPKISSMGLDLIEEILTD